MMPRSPLLLSILLSTSLFALGCAGLTAPLEPMPEDVVAVGKGVRVMDLPIEVLRVERYRTDSSRMSVMASVSLSDVPDGADIKVAIARLRLKSAVSENAAGNLALTWSPKLHVIQKALTINTKSEDGEEITAAQATREVDSMSLEILDSGRPMRVGSGIDTLEPGDTGLSYADLLRSWNPAGNTRVKESGLWLELDIARTIQAQLEEDKLILWMDGPVQGSDDPEIQERYHSHEAEMRHLQPYIHLEFR